jgi:hypothetical protein
MKESPNHSIERTEASRSAQSQSVARRRLASAAHAECWATRPAP